MEQSAVPGIDDPIGSLPVYRRRWADWAGFLFTLAFAVPFAWRMQKLGILLAPTLAHEFVVAFAFLLRRSLRARLTSVQARVCAYGTSFLVPLFVAVAHKWFPQVLNASMPLPVTIIGEVLWLSGCLFGFWGVWTLRYSFSIEPQARRLVTNGPYKLARHPIYLAYVLQYAGIFFVHASFTFAIVLIGWFLLAYARMRYEESILRFTFPEYGPYAARIAMFSPRFWKRAGLSDEVGTEPAALSFEILTTPQALRR